MLVGATYFKKNGVDRRSNILGDILTRFAEKCHVFKAD